MPEDFPEPLEAADSVAPQQIGIKPDDARITMPFYLKEIRDADDLKNRVLSILGWNAEGFDGSILRVPPRAVGLMPFLYASSVNLVGYGIPIEIAANPAEEDDPGEFPIDVILDLQQSEARGRSRRLRPTPIASDFALYPQYTAAVEFLQRPYHVLPNDEITIQTSQWHHEDQDKYPEPMPYLYADEWKRWVEIDQRFQPKIITATQGQLTFRTGDGTAPHGQCFAGSPRLPYPEKTLTVTWRQVPYRYLSSQKSYLERFANRINQFPFEIQGYSFEAGELLFLDFDYTRYTPPFPLTDPATGRFALEKWVDLKLVFGVARRAALNPPQLPNDNWVAHGWNVLPWFGVGWRKRRDFHYVASFHPFDPTNRAYWAPLFNSCPIELLFMDPDAPQPEGA